jgi:hypothetical protein
MKKFPFYILGVLLICLPALLPLFDKGFFTTDDGEWMIIRFSAFYSALRDGQFPVRFLHTLNSGYGYPAPNFLYPAFMYIGIPIQIMTSNFVNTIKIILGLSLIGSTIFTFLWLNKYFSKQLSLLASGISLYLPYHLFDVYTRGSVGEVLSFVWVPFIFWNIERSSLFFTTIGFFFLLLSHNTLAVLFAPLVFIYLIIKSYKDRKLLFKYLQSIILGAGIASFFIIPVIFELNLTRFFQTRISNPLSYFSDLKLIGPVTFFIIILSFLTFKTKINHAVKNKTYYLLFLAFSVISIFFSSNFSTFFWQSFPSSWIQFPFRLLSYLIIGIPFLAAYSLSLTGARTKLVLILIICALSILSARPFSTPATRFDKEDSFYYTNNATTTVHDEYMPVWVKKNNLHMPDHKVSLLKGNGKILKIQTKNNQISFLADLESKSLLQVNTIYWPGWKVFDSSGELKIDYQNTAGVMTFTLPKGKHQIQARFTETPLRHGANIISLLSVFTLIIISSASQKNKLKTSLILQKKGNKTLSS